MAYPVPVVEIAFAATPYAVSPTWTDVTPYVRSISTDRGRQDDWGTYSGTATVELDNRDRRFDPFNTAGAYYGNLTPRKQIRIRATYGGTTYDVFRGFISGFPPAWTDAGYDSTVQLECYDAMQLLGSVFLPEDWSKPYIDTLSPRHYWTCDDPISPFVSNTLKDRGTYPMDMTGTELQQGGQLAEGLADASVVGKSQFFVSAYTTTTGVSAATKGNYSIAAWVQPDATTSGGQILGGLFQGYNYWLGFDKSTGRFYAAHYGLNYGVAEWRTWYSSITDYDTAIPHHVAWTFTNSSTTGKLYVDGIDVSTAPTSPATNPLSISSDEVHSVGAGAVQQYLVWNSVRTQAEFQEIIRYSTAYLPETTSARVARIIGKTSFPSALVSTPGSPAGSLLQITDGAPAVSNELQLTADSEGAPLFVSKDGTLTMYSRTQQFTQSRSVNTQATYGSGGLKLGTEVQVQYDGDSVRNSIGIEMTGGAVVLSADTPSMTALGQANQVINTHLSSYTDAKQLADLHLLRGKNTYAKVSPVNVVLSPAESWASTLGLELHDKIVVNIQPPTGAVISQGLLVQHIHHDATPGEWRTTLTGSARWAANAPSATVLSATSVTSSSATLEGFVYTNGASTTAVFDYSTDPGFGSYTTVTAAQSPLPENGNITAAISGLTPATTYYVRIRTSNAFGSSTSASGSFTSAAAAPAATIGSPNGASSAGTTATVPGTVSWNGASTTVTVQVSTSSGFGSYLEFAATPSPVTAQSVSVSASATGLTLGTTYYARIKAVNSIGTTYSGTATFVTSALPSVTLGSTTNYNQDRATVNATISANYASSTVTFEVSSNGGASWSSPVTAVGSPVTGQSVSVYANLTGLSVGTAYIVRVKATNSSGTTTVQNSNGNFTTWSLRTFDANRSPGTWYGYIPTITPTGGSAITPYIYNVMMFGGGGSSYGSGGGGGHYYQTSSITVGGNGGLQLICASGGGYVSNGGASYINGWNGGSLGTGNIGVAGGSYGSPDVCLGNGGTSGTGYGGGAAQCNIDPKTGNLNWFGRGGGGGAGGAGGNASGGYGGSGGPGVTLSQGGVSRSGGGGGAGDGTYGNGGRGTYSAGYPGGGGSHDGMYNGEAGMVYFQYYAPANVF